MVRDGNILFSVHTENGDQITRAKDILRIAGASDITYTGEAMPPKPSKAGGMQKGDSKMEKGRPGRKTRVLRPSVRARRRRPDLRSGCPCESCRTRSRSACGRRDGDPPQRCRLQRLVSSQAHR